MLGKLDPLVQIVIEESGQVNIFGVDQLHLQGSQVLFSCARSRAARAKEREREGGGVEREEREEERLFTLHAMHHMYVTDF